MKPYTVQSFRNDRGEVAASRTLKPSGDGLQAVELSGTGIMLTPEADRLYRCGELTSLTITDPPAVGVWMIVFSSGAAPTRTTIPAGILGLEDFAAEANAVYEINVLDNRALVAGWPVSAAE